MCIFCPHLEALAWRSYRMGEPRVHTHTHTDTHIQTDAGNDNARKPKLASGKKKYICLFPQNNQRLQVYGAYTSWMEFSFGTHTRTLYFRNKIPAGCETTCGSEVDVLIGSLTDCLRWTDQWFTVIGWKNFTTHLRRQFDVQNIKTAGKQI